MKKTLKAIWDFIYGFGPEIFGDGWWIVLPFEFSKKGTIPLVMKIVIFIVGVCILAHGVFRVFNLLFVK